MKYVHMFSFFITNNSCKWKGEKCKNEDWSEKMTDMGNCLTFNAVSNSSDRLTSDQTGIQYKY